MRRSALAWLALIFLTAIWASSLILGRIAFTEVTPQVTPILFVTMRYSLACPPLLLIVIIMRKRPIDTAALKRNWKTVFIIGFTGPFLSQSLQYIGLNMTSAGETILLINMSPVFAVILALPLLGERITRHKVGGLLLATAGATLIVLEGSSFDIGLDLTRLIGDALIIISTFLFAINGISGKKAVKEVDSLSLTLYSTLVSVPFLWVTVFLLEDVTILSSVSPEVWIIFLWVGIINSAIGFVIYYEVMNYIEASQVQITLNLISVWGVLMAIMVLGEVLTSLKIIGGALTIIGVTLVQRKNMAHQPQTLEDSPS